VFEAFQVVPQSPFLLFCSLKIQTLSKDLESYQCVVRVFAIEVLEDFNTHLGMLKGSFSLLCVGLVTLEADLGAYHLGLPKLKVGFSNTILLHELFEVFYLLEGFLELLEPKVNLDQQI